MDFIPLTCSSWYRGQTKEEMMLSLLKQAAEDMGYRLVKKSVK
jgi:hypothetical protein